VNSWCRGMMGLLVTSIRRVSRLDGSSGTRAIRSLNRDRGLGLAGVPVGRVALHKSTDSVRSEVLVVLNTTRRPI